MSPQTSTCWHLITRAAAGHEGERSQFAKWYAPAIRAYLQARWRESPRAQDLDDAVQEVFVECFRDGGALDRLDSQRAGGFRAFLYGVVRNVARRFEERAAKRKDGTCSSDVFANVADEDTTLSVAFDQAYGRAVLREAFELLEESAGRGDDVLRRRVELLRLRFRDDIPIREIARTWNADAKHLHRELDRAKEEFQATLRRVLADHCPGLTPAGLTQRCEEILWLFS